MNFQTFHFKLNIIQLQSNEQMNVNINNKPSAFTQLTVILQVYYMVNYNYRYQVNFPQADKAKLLKAGFCFTCFWNKMFFCCFENEVSTN